MPGERRGSHLHGLLGGGLDGPGAEYIHRLLQGRVRGQGRGVLGGRRDEVQLPPEDPDPPVHQLGLDPAGEVVGRLDQEELTVVVPDLAG